MTPFTFEKLHLKSTDIYICSFESFIPQEYIKYLSAEENVKLNGFKSNSRKMEFIASRILRHRIVGFDKIEYNEVGAPYIKGRGYISISHTHSKAALAINNKFQIGLDLEKQRENILTLKHKFISQEEELLFDTSDKNIVTKIWSAKEALYKLAGRKGIHFKSELALKPINDSSWQGRITNPNHVLSVKLDIFDHQGTIISINTAPVEQNN